MRAGVAVGTLYRLFPSKVHLLIAALASRFEHMDVASNSSMITVGSPAERLHQVIDHLTRACQRNPLLTEATIRALVFADASAAAEVEHVERLVEDLLARAIGGDEVDQEHYHLARVISDAWLANLLAWLTGRTSVSDVSTRMQLAVHLLVGGDDRTFGSGSTRAGD